MNKIRLLFWKINIAELNMLSAIKTWIMIERLMNPPRNPPSSIPAGVRILTKENTVDETFPLITSGTLKIITVSISVL